MVSDPFLVGVFYGLVPAMGFLYILLHRYEGLFSERKAFLAFFIGIGAGLLATLLQLFLGPSTSGPLWKIAVFSLLFGLINTLLITMGLNSRRFRAQRDTPFHGVAYGLGFGAIQVLFFIGNAVSRLDQLPGDVVVEVTSLSLVGLYFIAVILVHACVGALIGRATAHGGLRDAIPTAALLESAYVTGFYALFLFDASTILAPLALVAAIWLIGRILKTVLDPLVPAEIRREIDIHQRRLARKTLRAINPPSGTDPDAARTTDSPPREDAAPDPPKSAP